MRRVLPFGHEFVEQPKGVFTRAAGHGPHQLFKNLRAHRANQPQHQLSGEGRATAGDGLVHDGKCIAHGAVPGFGQHGQCVIISLNVFFFADGAKLGNDVIKLDRMKAEILAAGADGLRNVLWLSGGHHEDNVRRRLFQSFQQRIKGSISDLMSFVENINLVPITRWTVARRLAQLTYFVNAAIGGSINFNHVNRVAGTNFQAGIAHAARLRSRTVPCTAIQRHGQDAGNGSLADATVPAEDVSMGYALQLDGVLESTGDMFLPDHLRKALRTIFARQYLVAHGKFDYTPQRAD